MTHKSMRKVMAAILSAAMLFQMGTAPATQAAVNGESYRRKKSQNKESKMVHKP